MNEIVVIIVVHGKIFIHVKLRKRGVINHIKSNQTEIIIQVHVIPKFTRKRFTYLANSCAA